MTIRVLIRGAGDLATGVAIRLFNSGMQVVMSELAQPTVVRRGAAFAQAIFAGECEVENLKAVRATKSQFEAYLKENIIPIIIDSDNEIQNSIIPDVVVDARMLKIVQLDINATLPFVIGLGPGFTVGVNCHVVVETNRGHDLGRLIWNGSAAPNTSIPGGIEGKSTERVLRSPANGMFESQQKIGNMVSINEEIAAVNGEKITAKIPGIVRGLLVNGLSVTKGMKVGDIDPRGILDNCFTVSDKARAIGGGVLEAILSNNKLRDKYLSD